MGNDRNMENGYRGYCIGACGLAPVFTVNDEVYGKATPELMKKVIEEYRNK